MRCGWVLAVVKSSLREGIAPLEALVYSLLKKPSLDPSALDNFYQRLKFSSFRKVVEMFALHPLQQALGEAERLFNSI